MKVTKCNLSSKAQNDINIIAEPNYSNAAPVVSTNKYTNYRGAKEGDLEIKVLGYDKKGNYTQIVIDLNKEHAMTLLNRLTKELLSN